MFSNPAFDQKRVVSLFSIFATVAALILFAWFLYEIDSLIPPFLVATMFAMTLIPEVDRLERRGYKRGLSIAIIYFLFLAFGYLLFRGLYAMATGEMAALVRRMIPVEIIHGNSKDVSILAARWMAHHNVPLMMRPLVLTQTQHLSDTIMSAFTIFEGWATNHAWFLIVPVITFFILLDFHKIMGKLLILAPLERRENILNAVTEIIAVFGNYVKGVMIVMALDMVTIYIVLICASLAPYAVPLAVTAGVLYTIPYFGAVVSTLLIGLVTLSIHGPVAAIVVTIVMILIHQVAFDNFVAPRVIGKSVNLHPLLTLFALLAGGTLFQIVGTLLAVPVAAAIQVILMQVFPQLRTDIVTEKRAERVVRATLASDNESAKPAARREEPMAPLKQEERDARESAADPLPVVSATDIEPAG